MDIDIEIGIPFTKGFITAVRQLRDRAQVPDNKPIDVLCLTYTPHHLVYLDEMEKQIKHMAGISNITIIDKFYELPPALSTGFDTMKIYMPLAGLIDAEAELAKLTKKIEDLSKKVKQVEGKLSNKGFLNKAPADIIAKEQSKLAEFNEQMNNLCDEWSNVFDMLA